MKANEFVKAYGLKRIRHLLTMSSNAIVYCLDGEHVHVDDLKRLVESHELIKSCGGLEQAKAYVIDANACGAFNDEIKLKQAILDVESCQ